MYKDKKIAAIIPARKGSKGIPNKNVILLNGLPLIAHSIIEAKKSTLMDDVIVSTDSEHIIKIAREYGAYTKGLRPTNLSNDTAILYDVLKYEVENHGLVERGFDILVLLQPTSPLRRSYMIDDALKRFIDEQQTSAVAVSEVEEHPILMRTVNKLGHLDRILQVDSTVRRQDLPKYYKVNGMIYINYISDIMAGYVSFNDNQSPIIIPKEYNVDIDEISDLEEAEARIRKLFSL